MRVLGRSLRGKGRTQGRNRQPPGLNACRYLRVRRRRARRCGGEGCRPVGIGGSINPGSGWAQTACPAYRADGFQIPHANPAHQKTAQPVKVGRL
jgi:hypothetical protein